MQKNSFFQASLIGSIAVLAACSSSSSTGTTTGTGDSGTSTSTTGTVTITSPADNGTLTLAADKTGNIAFATTNFTLMAPGTCAAGAANCGHIHVLIDGTACNDNAGGVPYNVAATASPATPNFGLCPTADGAHSVVLELHNDDHSPYQVNGATVSSSIKITTSG